MAEYTISIENRPGRNGGSIAWIDPSLKDEHRQILSENSTTDRLVPLLRPDVTCRTEGYYLGVEEFIERKVHGDVHKTVQEIVNTVGGRLATVLRSAGVEVVLHL